MISLFLVLTLAMAAATEPAPSPDPSSTLLVLEASEPARDQDCVFHSDCSYTGGDLTGARLTLRRIPVARSDRTAGDNPPAVYAPVSLEIDLDRSLEGGETQLAVFVSLPPLYLEHVIVRNSLARREANGNDVLILLAGQKEFSFIAGLDPDLDAEIEAFRVSSDYRNSLFSAPPDKRKTALDKAADFSVQSGGVYLFPPSPFYWKELPELKISVSLEVREGAEEGTERTSHLLSDSLASSWDGPRVLTGKRPGSAASSYPLEMERSPLR